MANPADAANADQIAAQTQIDALEDALDEALLDVQITATDTPRPEETAAASEPDYEVERVIVLAEGAEEESQLQEALDPASEGDDPGPELGEPPVAAVPNPVVVVSSDRAGEFAPEPAEPPMLEFVETPEFESAEPSALTVVDQAPAEDTTATEPEVAETPEPEAVEAPAPESAAAEDQEIAMASDPEVAETSEPEAVAPAPESADEEEQEIAMASEPEVAETPEPEAVEAPAPESADEEEQEIAMASEPEVAETPEPEAVEAPTPESAGGEEQEIAMASEPEAAETPAPETAAAEEPEIAVASEPEVAETDQITAPFEADTSEPASCETSETDEHRLDASIEGVESSPQEPDHSSDSQRAETTELEAVEAPGSEAVREQEAVQHTNIEEKAGLEEVRAAEVSRLEPVDAEAFGAVLDAMLDQAASEDTAEQIARDGGENFVRGALSLWRFAATRRLGEARVRVHDLEPGAGGGAPRTALEVVNDDMRYLLDSLSALITSQGLEIQAVLHPMLHVSRNDEGGYVGLRPVNDPDAVRESWIQLQMDHIADPQLRTALEEAAGSVLRDVRAAHRDRETMVERLRDCAAHLRQATPEAKQEAGWEAAAFLDWLADGSFTLLACRDYALSAGEMEGYSVSAGRGLGLMRDPGFTVLRGAEGEEVDWSPEMAAFIAELEPVAVLKANRRSTVRRDAHFDLISVKRFGDNGRVVGQTVFVGLFAAEAYTRSPTNIPLLRRKVRRIIARSGFSEGGHDAVALANILDTHPRDELFQASEEELRAQALGALQLKTRPRTRLFVRADRFGRYLSCLVYVSRERFDSALRRKVAQILCESTGGRIAEFTPSYGSDGQIRIHFVIAFDKPGGAAREVDVAGIERRIEAAARDWTDGLREALDARFGAAKGAALLKAYGHGFSAGYREGATPSSASEDLERLDALSAENPIGVAFFRQEGDRRAALRVKLYRYGEPAPLSDAIPILENMGLRILEEHPYEIQRRRPLGEAGADAQDWLYIHDFLTETSEGAEIPLEKRGRVMEEGFVAIWREEVEDDRLNKLILTAGLSARQLALLRAYSRFLRQARIPYSVEYMEDALIENPKVAEALWRLFDAQFSLDQPGGEVERELKAERIETEIDDLLEEVARLDVDRILRRMRNAIRATLRTNFFQKGADGRAKSYFSFKLQSGALEDLPAPRPWREIWVYSASVEGVHLRGGPVARGGLRWSDRREDFRTEVLGLVKAQQVKNAVIVPVGSKGGFFPKKLPVGAGREEIQAEAIKCYRTFLRGLLDVTDNLVDAKVIPPKDVARRDGDDPYLVVAADKGTATFSDIANAVAGEYGFWLGDAFASGGGEGYDHKAMAITARGAWEAVKRHFRELGKDIQTEPFTAIGVGDMSGDVFGNGMLLSPQTRLLAAFDHRDIFIDPNPDVATSYAERKRLFELPRSSWADYDKSLISKGGGVFSRNLKSIPLTPEICELTGLKNASVTPFELIQTLLAVKADLLWFGGIGTYVKAEGESHEAVGDRANDAIRINAGELGAKVVGEGANLGVTQAGRIALSTRGVKINTDAVDNAAGVDCSDHEVNIKIALGAAMGAGKLSAEERSALLKDMTDEVARLVLASNYAQTGALSVAEARAPSRLDLHRRFIRNLEAEGKLDRALEGLPNEEEMTERERTGRGLTRPEIAVLVAYAKNGLQQTLLASDLPDDPYLEHWLIRYFPEPMRDRFRDEILGHRLRREIIANQLANAFINDGGPAYALRLQEETGAAPAEAARAYLIARELFEFGALAREIDALDNKISAQTQVQMRLAISDALVSQTHSVLQQGEPGAVDAVLASDRQGVKDVASAVSGMLSDFAAERRDETLTRFMEAGAPKDLTERLATLAFLGGAIDIVETARNLGRGVLETADTYFAVGSRFRLEWLRIEARAIDPDDDWERIAIGRLISDLRTQQSAIAAAALRISPEGCSGCDAVEAWAKSHPALVSRADRVFTELRAGGSLSVAKLAVASSQLRGWE